jgi:hypothetical protein
VGESGEFLTQLFLGGVMGSKRSHIKEGKKGGKSGVF